MHETTADLERLQALLDASYASAGEHLRRIITPDRRLSAQQVSELLQGMCLLVLATATADGRPIAAPVDGIFFRGEFHFGSSPDSVRFRHLRRRSHVSATHLPSEQLAVTVHGQARPIDVGDPQNTAFRQTLLDVYVPRYGPGWETEFLDSGPLYARIEPERMFTFHMKSDS
jgi:Pyridoxamine 5'-phosphate oxidase